MSSKKNFSYLLNPIINPENHIVNNFLIKSDVADENPWQPIV